MSIWAAIAGGAGEFLRQSDKAREEERIRLKEEALAKLQAEKDAKAEERYLDEQMQKRQKTLIDEEKDSRNRQDTLANRASIADRAKQSLALRERQLNQSAANTAATRENTALYRQTQLDQRAESAAAKKAKEADEKAYANYEALSKSVKPVLEAALANDSSIGQEQIALLKNELMADLEGELEGIEDPTMRARVVQARLPYLIQQLKNPGSKYAASKP